MTSNIFISRPILAGVCAAVILLAGLLSIPSLPVSQYPNIAPPTISVNSVYIGANAEAVEQSVTNPLEEQHQRRWRRYFRYQYIVQQHRRPAPER